MKKIQIPASPLKSHKRNLENQLSATSSTLESRDITLQLQLLSMKPILDSKSISNAIQILSKQLIQSRNIARLLDFQSFLYGSMGVLDCELVGQVILDLFDNHYDIMSTFTLLTLLIDCKKPLSMELKQKLARILGMFDDNSILVHVELMQDMKDFNAKKCIVPNLYVVKDWNIIDNYIVQEEFKVDYVVMDWLLTLEYDNNASIGIDVNLEDYVNFESASTDTQAKEQEVSRDEFQDLNDRLQQLLNNSK